MDHVIIFLTIVLLLITLASTVASVIMLRTILGLRAEIKEDEKMPAVPPEVYVDTEEVDAETKDPAIDAKNVFLANMSHEIRTPMNAIVGYSDLIMKEALTDEGREYAHAIKSSSNMLLQIINNILDFTKIAQGKLEIVEEEYSTEGLLREVSDIMHLQADRKKIKIVSSVDMTLPGVLYGDRMRIRQALVNIVGNAVKFTEKGQVRITADWEQKDDKALITMIVVDTGIGIAPENMSKLFEEFEMIDAGKNFGRPGTRVGLNITKALLEMMGGSISVESEYGVGTTVTMKFMQKIVDKRPMAELSKETGDVNMHQGKLVAPDAKVLVVDDNRVNLELMRNCLKQYRIVPTLVESGPEAIESSKGTMYDLIFMDQMMPEMDGIEAMKAIRALGGHYSDKFPIIALTANAVAGTRNSLMAEGFTDYASKPMQIKTLEYLLQRHLPKGRCTIEADVDLSVPTSVAKIQESEVGRKTAESGNDSRQLAECGNANNPAEPNEATNNRIFDLPGYVNQTMGLNNAGGDVEQYRAMIEIVYKYADEKLRKIRELYEAEDYTNYTIEVHALKSNAATVGAVELSALAQALENAGKSGNIALIKAKTGRLLEWYGDFREALGKVLGVDSEETDFTAGAAAEANAVAPDKAADTSGRADRAGTAGCSDTPERSDNAAPAEESARMSASGEEYFETFREIENAIKEKKYSNAMDLFGILEFFELPAQVSEAVKYMLECAKNDDWQSVLDILADLR